MRTLFASLLVLSLAAAARAQVSAAPSAEHVGPHVSDGCLQAISVTAQSPTVRAAASLAAGAPGAPGAAPLLATDPRITPLVAQVSANNILATVTQLSSYFTRRADSATVLVAKDWIVSQLAAIPGLTVTTQSFSGTYGPNIVAEKLGSVHPERLVILGAHYDSINASGASQPAPGADDNASGSGGLLEAARILAQGHYENTVRLCWFCAEEFGTVGSEAMAAGLDASNTQVVGMLNMDMIAHLEPGDAFDLDFATNDTDAALTQFCRDITAAYVPTLPTVQGVLTAGSSDHAPFAQHGFPAAFFFEDLTQFSQVLHTANDTLPNSPNNFTLAQDITQAFVASAATLAAPVDLQLAHVPLADSSDAGGPYPLSVTATSLTAASVAAVEAHYSVNGGPELIVPLIRSADPATWVGSLPGVVGAFADVHYWLLATDSAGFTQWLPESFAPGGKSYAFSVGSFTPVYSEGFEGPGDAGWTHAQLATQDDWQRGAPQGKAGDPAAAAQGSSVWGNDLGGSGFNGEYQPNVNNYLESPVINCSGKSALHLRYQRWLTVEDGLYDQATIKLNGTTVWSNPATADGTSNTIDSAWTLHDVNVSALADGNPSVKLRFQLQSDGGAEFGGWNIDDLKLVSEGPGTKAPLVASASYLSGSAGGSVALALDAGAAHAGRKYLIAVSASGTAPGTHLGSVTVPLNFDAVTNIGFQFLNSPFFAGFGGFLDGQGKASASFVSPPIASPSLAGISLSFAAFTLGPIDFASNAVSVEYEP